MAALPVNKRQFILRLFIYVGMRAVAFRIESFWATFSGSASVAAAPNGQS
jgi:hypothetical protein